MPDEAREAEIAAQHKKEKEETREVQKVDATPAKETTIKVTALKGKC